MKLANIKTQTFSEAAAPDLDNSIKLWIENNGKEKVFVNLLFSFNGAMFTAILVYTE